MEFQAMFQTIHQSYVDSLFDSWASVDVDADAMDYWAPGGKELEMDVREEAEEAEGMDWELGSPEVAEATEELLTPETPALETPPGLNLPGVVVDLEWLLEPTEWIDRDLIAAIMNSVTDEDVLSDPQPSKALPAASASPITPAMVGLPFPNSAVAIREQSWDSGTPFSNGGGDIPIDPALSEPPLDPALMAESGVYANAEVSVARVQGVCAKFATRSGGTRRVASSCLYASRGCRS
ncbi:hypothetical protein NUW54_g13343 [Trametes sanguinea]|uniref:Uncharacterized protein n=1 Tax=Trametes sanguinea TaxID=158606 RepID=A0ACC1MP00_9APHY|nr:hypothetical protein NUW54_g13343 [Trametes sanguinea]